MGDFQDLFARLRPASDTQPASNYQQPSVSSPIVSPSLHGPQPRHSDIMSQNVTTSNTPRPDAGASDRTANLLNLLKFNQSSSRQTSQSAIPGVGQNGDAQAQAAGATTVDRPLPQSPSQPGRTSSRPSIDSPQDMLLNLLKRPASSASSSHKPVEKYTPTENISVRDTVQGKLSDSAMSPLLKEGGSKPGVFSYVNPFDQLRPSSPHSRSAKQSIESANVVPKANSPGASAISDGKNLRDSLLGTGSQKSEPKPVAEALSNIAEQADKDVQDALASVEAERAADDLAQENPEALKEAVHEAAVEIQDELQDGKTKSELERIVSKPITEALQETAEAVAEHGIVDNWESAEAEEAADAVDEHTVVVYNLPMRPFVSLEVKGEASKPAKVRNDVVMKIATLKKEFDQIDRTLASASPNYIVYAMAKGGGFRVIRQDDGSNRTNFRGSDNVIFHVSVCHSPSLKIHNEATETVLATGTSGAVYWTSIPTSQADSLEEIDLDKRGFIMPPLPSTDENTSTSQLKTRAKKSSRHPEFFAVGRGKSIYIVYPAVAGSSTYINPDTRVIDTQRYLNQRQLKIATGKAGKDFTFSEDDTAIVSLDKHGRLKFWDITGHLDLANNTIPGRPINMESKVPVMTLWLTSSTAKAWPTSVQFVDKDRPMAKGIASRYLLVGLKQNHAIQLWDLGLGKAVQEINLPHANETDAICSIAYHAKSGIIAVGHPTRNSIYFIHLSAPKYTIPSMTQSSYLQGLVNKESRIPRPESTAIMSGLREISLDPVGGMRSIDILSPSSQTAEKDAQDGDTVLEVYVMHSRGVTCLNLKKQDFGWNDDGKVVVGRNAEAEGVVTVSELLMNNPAETAQTEEVKPVNSNNKILLKPATKPEANNDVEAALPKAAEPPSTPKTIAGGLKAEKKKDKKKPEHGEDAPVTTSKPPSYADALSRAAAPAAAKSQPATVTANGTVISKAPPAETIDPIFEPNAVASETYVKALSERMDELYNRMDEQRRISEAANAARQEAVLRLVSATLTENVEKSLHSIVSSSINEKVVPAISNVTTATLEAKVPNAVSHQVAQSVPSALQKALPDAIAKSLQSPGALQTISEHVAAKLAPQIEKDFNSNFKSSILPSFTRTASDAAQSTTAEVERRVLEQLRQVQGQNQRDQTKIDQLTRLTSELSSTITSMAGVQAELHKELAATRADLRQLREQIGESMTAHLAHEAPYVDKPPVKAEEERDEELEGIAQLVAQSSFEEATIRWLQSPRQATIFEELFASMLPESFLPQLNPIVNLSVSAAVSSMLDQGRLEPKLGYLETVLKVVNPGDSQINEYAPRMMEVLKERVSDLFMRVAEERPGERQLLSRLRTLVRNVGAFKSMVGTG